MPETISLDEAAATTVTGDIWLFRGKKAADRAIRVVTNSPVNHVAVAVAIDDLPPLLWHAELGASLPDVWTGEHRRGAQLHRLEDAVSTWVHTYDQHAWFRQIDPQVSRDMETRLLATVDELSGSAFPRTGALAKSWLLGRVRRSTPLEQLYCAEVVAITYERMGLLSEDRPANWYDPGRFWSGDQLVLEGAALGAEVAVTDVAPRPETEGESGNSTDEKPSRLRRVTSFLGRRRGRR